MREAEKRLCCTQNHEYPSLIGIPEFCDAGAKFCWGDKLYNEYKDVMANAQAVSGSGSLRLIAQFLKNCNITGEVRFPNPTWTNQHTIFRNAGLQTSNYTYINSDAPTLNFKGMMDDINSAPDHSAFVFHACAHNPTGVVYSRKAVTSLCRLLENKSEQYGHPIWLIADEPYRFLTYDGVEVPSVLPLYQYAVVISSFSKNLSLPGERVGYVAVSPKLADRAKLMAGLTLTNRILGFVNPPVVGQHIMAAALGSQVDGEIYARRRQAMAEVLTDAGYSFQMPAGAFYFFPQAPGGDDVAFVNRLVEERVLAVPGSGFGCPGYFRLAFCVDETVIRNAAEGFARAYAAVAGK